MTDTTPRDEPPPVESDCRPQVALPPGGVPVWAIGMMAGAFGLAVLLTLNAHRAESSVAMPVDDAVRAVPALPRALAASSAALLDAGQDDAAPRLPAFARAEPGGGPAPFSEPWPWSGGAVPFARAPALPARMPAPAPGRSEAPGGTIVFATEPMPGAPRPGGGGGGGRFPAGPQPGVGGGSAIVYDSSAPAAGDDKQAGDGAARATIIRNRAAVVAQGELLPATLETPVSSARPGPIRAIVSRDVRGFDGGRVLIPRGSRLIGEYRADPAAGKRRILANWTRLIRPDGVAIRIGSPAADALGGTGIPGRVDTHFLARFANAALQSALQIGVNLASRAGDGSVIIGNTPQVAGAMGQNIIPGADEPPTVTVRAGTPVSVFVARDLDFTGVPVTR